MKKTLKHCIQAVATFALTAIIATAAPTAANAEYVTDSTNGIRYQDTINISVDGCYNYGAGGTVYVDVYNDGDTIKNVKSNSSNLLAKVVRIYNRTTEKYNYNTNSYETVKSTPDMYIGCFAKKSGKYTVTFDLVDSIGNIKGTYKITVTTNIPSYQSGVKKVTYAGKAIETYYPFTSKTSGKLKVTMKKGYAIKSIKIFSFDAKGEWVSKTVKNGATIKLAKSAKSKNDYTSISNGKKYGNIYTYDLLFPQTSVYITYENIKTKETLYWGDSLYTINPKSSLMK